MVDVVDSATRSRMMAGIRGSNTKPELAVRRGLHALGFRYRLHDRRLPGAPDLVFPKFRAALFVHGCFWHGHDCHLFKWPSSRPDFWRSKIAGNVERDRRQLAALGEAGWRTGIVWECALKGRARRPIAEVLEMVASWLRSDEATFELSGKAV